MIVIYTIVKQCTSAERFYIWQSADVTSSLLWVQCLESFCCKRILYSQKKFWINRAIITRCGQIFFFPRMMRATTSIFIQRCGAQRGAYELINARWYSTPCKHDTPFPSLPQFHLSWNTKKAKKVAKKVTELSQGLHVILRSNF